MRPALRIAVTLGAKGLGSTGATLARAAIVVTTVLGFWPLIAVVGRRFATPPRG